MSDDRFDRLHPKPVEPPEPRTNLQLTETTNELSEKIAKHDNTNRLQSIWLAILYVSVFILAGIGGWKLAGHIKAPVQANSTAVTALTAKVDSLGGVIAAQQDTILAIRNDMTAAKEASVTAVTMAEEYGHRVDEIWKSQRHDYINEVAAPKK